MAENFLAEQRADLSRKAWEMRVHQGWTLRRIAEELQVHPGTVCRWLQHYRRQAHDFLVKEAVYLVAEEIEILDAIVEKAMDAWERSCRPADQMRVETKDGPDGVETKTVAIRRGQSGDPRLLREVREALRQRRECLGINVGEDGEPTDQEETADVIRSEIARLRAERRGAGGGA